MNVELKPQNFPPQIVEDFFDPNLRTEELLLDLNFLCYSNDKVVSEMFNRGAFEIALKILDSDKLELYMQTTNLILHMRNAIDTTEEMAAKLREFCNIITRDFSRLLNMEGLWDLLILFRMVMSATPNAMHMIFEDRNRFTSLLELVHSTESITQAMCVMIVGDCMVIEVVKGDVCKQIEDYKSMLCEHNILPVLLKMLKSSNLAKLAALSLLDILCYEDQRFCYTLNEALKPSSIDETFFGLMEWGTSNQNVIAISACCLVNIMNTRFREISTRLESQTLNTLSLHVEKYVPVKLTLSCYVIKHLLYWMSVSEKCRNSVAYVDRNYLRFSNFLSEILRCTDNLTTSEPLKYREHWLNVTFQPTVVTYMGHILQFMAYCSDCRHQCYNLEDCHALNIFYNTGISSQEEITPHVRYVFETLAKPFFSLLIVTIRKWSESMQPYLVYFFDFAHYKNIFAFDDYNLNRLVLTFLTNLIELHLPYQKSEDVLNLSSLFEHLEGFVSSYQPHSELSSDLNILLIVLAKHFRNATYRLMIGYLDRFFTYYSNYPILQIKHHIAMLSNLCCCQIQTENLEYSQNTVVDENLLCTKVFEFCCAILKYPNLTDLYSMILVLIKNIISLPQNRDILKRPESHEFLKRLISFLSDSDFSIQISALEIVGELVVIRYVDREWFIPALENVGLTRHYCRYFRLRGAYAKERACEIFSLL